MEMKISFVVYTTNLMNMKESQNKIKSDIFLLCIKKSRNFVVMIECQGQKCCLCSHLIKKKIYIHLGQRNTVIRKKVNNSLNFEHFDSIYLRGLLVQKKRTTCNLIMKGNVMVIFQYSIVIIIILYGRLQYLLV